MDQRNGFNRDAKMKVYTIPEPGKGFCSIYPKGRRIKQIRSQYSHVHQTKPHRSPRPFAASESGYSTTAGEGIHEDRSWNKTLASAPLLGTTWCFGRTATLPMVANIPENCCKSAFPLIAESLPNPLYPNRILVRELTFFHLRAFVDCSYECQELRFERVGLQRRLRMWFQGSQTLI